MTDTAAELATVHDLIPRLPDPEALLAHCKAVAVLDITMDRDVPWGGMHAFDPHWGDGVALASMDNGSGDLYAVAFGPAGVFLYGFDHECDATPWREEPRVHWPGLLDGLPAALAAYPAEEAFLFDGFFDATLCAWRETGAGAWQCGPVVFEDGETDGAWLFELLADGTLEARAKAYAEDAEDYWERPVDRAAVASVLAGEPLTATVVAALNPSADFAAVAAEAAALGFPVTAAGVAP
ncbi:hypothetical protein FGW37_18035 [Streptomyces rectiverticillatus]|uniref:hypothetical protein n=1 Tax=Streptomyces rectiverticillatus TaxID=173860 RepID=UPI0015C3BEA5|nr:hypothetical protein [Streptomyces rectiverticillatus]QLE73234.1 hypothetical protein FGW37_18035 [Streptomyces rectiverticillatus]